MAPALLIFAVLICCSGVSSGATLTQPPSQSVSLGQTAKLLCTISGSVSNFHWVRQRLGQGPHFVIYGSTRGEGIPDRFTSSGSGSDYYLTITNSKAEDEADYYCVAWESSGRQWIFGGGTHLTVTGGPSSPPTVHVYPPSPEEKESKNKATLVCLVTDFSPPGLTVNWEADGTAVSSGVETTRPTKVNDKYLVSSYLTLTPSDWEKHQSYTCKVTHEGSNYVKSVSHSQCP